MLIWTFGHEFCPVECHAYTPAPAAPPVAAPCGLDWRTVGRLMAGALWGGVAVGVLIALF